jgi:hypothetical protein
VYGLTGEAVRERIQAQNDLDSVANLAWVKVFRKEASSRADLERLLPVDPKLVEAAVDELVALGRLEEAQGALRSTNFVLALGSDQGWEAALLDHFRAVAVAIATKVRSGLKGSDEKDRVGGSTFTFTVTNGHPFEKKIYELLKAKRLEIQSLWDEVAEYNNAHPPDPDDAVRVTFYLGQTLEQTDAEDEGTAPNNEVRRP